MVGIDASDRTVRIACCPAVQSADRTLRPILFGYLPIRRPVEAIEAPVHSAAEIEKVMKLGGEAGAGLIVMPETFTAIYRETICALADRYRLPAIYPFRLFISSGGLLSYGIDTFDLLRGAASYVDRILRGAKPEQLPVQQPTKFELVINLKTAKSLGLVIPHNLLVLADEVIE